MSWFCPFACLLSMFIHSNHQPNFTLISSFPSQGHCCCSVAKSCLSLRPCELQHPRLLYPPISPRVCSCPLSRWCHPTISFSVTPFSSCLQPFPASRSFPVSRLVASGGQSIRASASASVLPMNIQDGFPLGLLGWITLQSEGLSRVFSNTTVQKHQFFRGQPSLWSNSYLYVTTRNL